MPKEILPHHIKLGAVHVMAETGDAAPADSVSNKSKMLHFIARKSERNEESK